MSIFIKCLIFLFTLCNFENNLMNEMKVFIYINESPCSWTIILIFRELKETRLKYTSIHGV